MNTGKFDILFILVGLASLTMMADDANIVDNAVNLSPLLQAMILAISAIIIASFIVLASAIDRKCSEDYLYQIMANAGLVGTVTCLLANLFWLFAMAIWKLPDLTGQNLAGITLLAWVIGYYWFRYRGLKS